MAFYLTVMSVGTLFVALINIFFFAASPVYAILASVFCTLLAFALDGLIAYLVHLVPNRLFPAESSRYQVSERAARFYEGLGVKRWKDKVWELGGIGGFSKKNLNEPLSGAYIERFLTESHKGVLTHRLGYIAGFLTMLAFPNEYAFTIALPVALVNLYLNILPTVVLRYNTPRLLRLYERLKRKEERKKGQS